MWSHVIISLNIQGKEGVGDTVSKSVELEYKVEVGQLGTPFRIRNCMVVEPLKWEKKEDIDKKSFFQMQAPKYFLFDIQTSIQQM